MTNTSPAAGTPLPRRFVAARAAAGLAALAMLANGVLALLSDPAALSDHTVGAGAASELLTAASFVAGGVALAFLTPPSGAARWLWLLAPLGLGSAGATMVAVPIVGSEPPEWLFLVTVCLALLGTVTAGILGARRFWPWWVGAVLALLLPAMFLLPFNGLFMTAVWAAVALTAVPRHHGAARAEAESARAAAAG